MPRPRGIRAKQLGFNRGAMVHATLPTLNGLSLPSCCFCFLRIKEKMVLVNKKQKKINLRVYAPLGLRKMWERDETPV